MTLLPRILLSLLPQVKLDSRLRGNDRLYWGLPVFLLFSFNAQASDLTCPKTISVDFQSLSTPVEGWRSFYDKINSPYNLQSVSFYEGPPEEMASQVPDKILKSASEWKFRGDRRYEYYVVCTYSNTSVQLTRSIAPGTTSCRVDYEANTTNGDGSRVPQTITCK